jgi:hypothetical protein
VDAAQALLSSLPTSCDRWEPDLTQVRPNTAGARVNMLGLWSERPRRLGLPAEQPVPPGPLTATELFDEVPRPLLEIVAQNADRDPLVMTMANRLLHPPIDSGIELIDAIRGADPSTLRGHCLDAECVRLLGAGDHPGFLARRAELVREAVSRHVDDHAEWGARDRRSVTELLSGADHVA